MAIVPAENPYYLFSLWYAEAAGCDAIDDHTALTLATGLDDAKKRYFMAPGVGHYGIFNGSKWRDMIAPIVDEWILAHN